jgi:glutathionyl-hydroquinone reductase
MKILKLIQQKSVEFVKQQQRYTLASKVTMTWTRRTLIEFVLALNHQTPKHSLCVTVHETTMRINFHTFADKAAILMLFNPSLIPYK